MDKITFRRVLDAVSALDKSGYFVRKLKEKKHPQKEKENNKRDLK